MNIYCCCVINIAIEYSNNAVFIIRIYISHLVCKRVLIIFLKKKQFSHHLKEHLTVE